jgi:hypothetical protein
MYNSKRTGRACQTVRRGGAIGAQISLRPGHAAVVMWLPALLQRVPPAQLWSHPASCLMGTG